MRNSFPVTAKRDSSIWSFPCTALCALAAILFSITGCAGTRHFERTGSRPSDLAVVNARIFTSNDRQPQAEAMAVKAGRIVYVGDNAGLADHVGPATRIINARKRRVTPGFIDSHCHVLWIGALLYLMPDNLFACQTFEDIRRTIVDWAERNPGHPFVGGIGWRMDQVPGGVPTRQILDEIIGDRPVILMSYSGQSGWLNSMALELFSQRNAEALERLKPVRDESGELTGECTHFHAINFMDFFTLEEWGPEIKAGLMNAISKVIDEAASVGVTAVHDMQIYPEFIPLLLEFRERGGLEKTRARCALYIDPYQLRDEDSFKSRMDWWKELGEKESDPHLLLGSSLKLYIDGCPDNRTSYFFEPYIGDPKTCGDPVWTQDEFDKVIGIVDAMGLQACTHACGDAGINRVINSYELARRQNGGRDSRHRIEHCEFPTHADIERMGRLGITAAMQPCHYFGDPMVESGLGHERMQGFMPWRSLQQAGVTIGFGSDWCNSPLNPFYGLLLASKRFNYKGRTDWGAGERITIADAVRHWTIGSAETMFMDKDIGSIEVGKLADFVMFNTDPLKADSLWFLLTHELELGKLDDFVDLTVLGGKIVYRRPDARNLD